MDNINRDSDSNDESFEDRERWSIEDGKSKLADHVFPKGGGGRTDDRRSRAHLFVADHFLLMYRRPRRFRMRNEMASRNLSSVIYDAPCRTGVPIVATNHTDRDSRTLYPWPSIIENVPSESFFCPSLFIHSLVLLEWMLPYLN